MTSASTLVTKEVWTPESFAGFFALAARHRTVRDRDDVYPAIDWQDRGDNYFLDVLGYLENTDNRWVWRAEFAVGHPYMSDSGARSWRPNAHGMRAVESRDFNKVVPVVVGWLNNLDAELATLGPRPEGFWVTR